MAELFAGDWWATAGSALGGLTAACAVVLWGDL